jgi:hypothetical protein
MRIPTEGERLSAINDDDVNTQVRVQPPFLHVNNETCFMSNFRCGLLVCLNGNVTHPVFLEATYINSDERK